MSLKYGKSEVNAIAAVLDEDHATVEDAARACLRAMEDIFASRASFVVVGQVTGTKERGSIPPDDPEAVRMSLGWYSTEGDARAAGDSLWFNTASGDTLHTWVLPVFHGTPAEWHGKRKQQHVAAQEKRKQAVWDRRMVADQKFREAQQKRADELRERERKAGGQTWPCYANRIKANECRHEPACK